MLHPFFDDPPAFLRHLTEFGAVVGGIAALSFILQDASLTCDVLQIYAGRNTFGPLVMRLSSCPANSSNIATTRARAPPRQFGAERDISGIITFRLRSGRSIAVYKAAASTGCSTLVRSPSTAVMNYITEHSFACAYPALTLHRRALLSDVRLSTLSDVDCVVLGATVRGGFTFAPHAGVWAEYRDLLPHPAPNTTNPCFRKQYICPQQSRHFGDPGCLLDYMDPLYSEHSGSARGRELPPFGLTVTWRLLTLFLCQHRCDTSDPVLNDWLVSTPILAIPDPFPQPPTVAPRQGRVAARDGHHPSVRGRRAVSQ
ncbi:hypothetical protein C8Q76DRAFT_607229 [Earliella scabrosa]|nr:hypothetical protein C8Q76DRAFT_607229 [Earliella scabrosa]